LALNKEVPVSKFAIMRFQIRVSASVGRAGASQN